MDVEDRLLYPGNQTRCPRLQWINEIRKFLPVRHRLLFDVQEVQFCRLRSQSQKFLPSSIEGLAGRASVSPTYPTLPTLPAQARVLAVPSWFLLRWAVLAWEL